MSNLERKARILAHDAHEGQIRKYIDDPYIVHPAAVVDLVRTVPHTKEMLAGAWLHDVVEDTPIRNKEIEYLFGSGVARLVENLTDVSRPSDGNRAARKALDLAHTAKATPDAKTIKLADLIDNTKRIVAEDPAFAKVYLVEKELLLGVLTDGDATLWRIAYRILQESKTALNRADVRI